MSRVKAILEQIGASGLKCTVPGCKVTIYALTGFQELGKLQKHMAKAHRARWSTAQTLHNRVSIEDQNKKEAQRKARRRS